MMSGTCRVAPFRSSAPSSGYRSGLVRCTAVAAVILLTACEAPAPEGGGVEDCSNPGAAKTGIRLPSPSELDPPTWRAHEVIRLGGVAGPEAAAGTAPPFGDVVDAARDGRGRTYVADSFARAIFVFGAEGRLLRAIGGRGEGPGEFAGRTEIAVTRGDTLRAFDFALWRLTVFDPELELVRTESPPATPHIGQISEVGFDAAGRLYQLSYAGFEASLLEALDGRSDVVVRGRNALARWDAASGRWIDLLTVPSVEVYFSGGLSNAPFGRRPLWATRPEGGLWYADSGEYALHRVDADGYTDCLLTVQSPPPPVTAVDRERYRSAADAEDISEAHRRRIRERRRELPLPDRKPALQRLHVASDGRVWVRPNLPASGSPDGVPAAEWHVWSPDGRLLARALLPPDFVPRRIDRDSLLGIRRGPLDEDSVVTLAIARP